MSQAVQFKGSMFTLTILQILSDDVGIIDLQVRENLEKAPKFFTNAPVVIDLTEVKITPDTLEQIIYRMRSNDLLPVGIISGDANVQHHAIVKGLAIFPKSKQTSPIRAEKPAEPAANKKTATTTTEKAKVILQPVRSGQQIYAKNTDLIVLNSVSPGAEIIADGNIHVYGALHGRALDGVNGNNEARIFCHKLDAELVSIAGLYQLSDDFAQYKDMDGIQIFLDSDKLCIEKI